MLRVLSVLVGCVFAFTLAFPGRIQGGSDAVPGSTPWNVMVVFRDAEICAGTILSPWTILTARQCVDVNNPTAFGILVNTTKMSEHGELFRVQSILPHPGVAGKSRRYDLALLYLRTPMEISKDVHPIAVGELDDVEGLDVVTYGWGMLELNGEKPDHLQKMEMRTIGKAECQKEWEGLNDVEEDEICAKGANAGSLCYGDAGGALIYEGEAIGIYSWGFGCEYGRSDIFINMAYHKKWIMDNVQN